LIELGHCAQRCDTQVEIRTAGKFDVFPRFFHPVRDCDDDRNAKIARHIQYPQMASRRSQLGSQIQNAAVAKTIEIDLSSLQAIVPPDRTRIPLDEFEETLEDRFLERIASRTAVRVGTEMGVARSVVEKIEQVGWECA